MSPTWSHNSILGFTDTETVLLDFDNTTLKTVKYWARRAMNWFKLGGFIILKSSERNYHIVFDRPVSWSENMKVVAWVALLSQRRELQRWLLMQCIKMSSTLRVSPKLEKPSPRIVYREGAENNQIAGFLRSRRKIKDIMKQMS
ncbi:MAG: hypothetical protein ACFFCW_30090 [Candidatus Hodarchaeota archaeon]